ncbi:MAG: site-specific DNA-methyltransferase [Rhodospirillales bacterium]|nr:MAG: site-specific DNA-methyltransferase [Rhodospirillales bacterium]
MTLSHASSRRGNGVAGRGLTCDGLHLRIILFAWHHPSQHVGSHQGCQCVRNGPPPRVSDDYPSTVWQLPTVKVGEKTDHPTSKPVDVFAIPMRQHAKPGEVCYQPFSGSGSQIIAGETTGRRVYAIEISPQYVDVAVKRWHRSPVPASFAECLKRSGCGRRARKTLCGRGNRPMSRSASF